MQRIKHSTAATALPAYVDDGSTPGYFQNENVALGQEGTVVNAGFLNGIQEELLTVIEAAGLTPSPTNFGQLLASLVAGYGMPFGTGPGGFGTWLTLPGGFILQAQDFGANLMPNTWIAFAFPTAFNDVCMGVLITQRDALAVPISAVVDPAAPDTQFLVYSTYNTAPYTRSFHMFAIGK